MNNKNPGGKANGGLARAAALTTEQRREIAKKAAVARWGIRASHRGNFKDQFGIDVDCYVLEDEQKTAVVSQRGLGLALGLAESGSAIQRFLRGEKIAPYVGGELWEKLQNPLVFQWQSPGGNAQPPATVHGYDVTILIDICKAVLAADADGKLLARQVVVAKQARVILNASAKAGIKGLVYALAGYDATRAEVIAAFKEYVREEAREYEKEFPPELYKQWYRLYRLPGPPKGKPWKPFKFASLTRDQVYYPLARSSGRILKLTRERKAKSSDPRAKLHQFLSDIGVKVLRTHLGQLLGMAQISESREQYESFVEKVFGDGRQMALPFEKKT